MGLTLKNISGTAGKLLLRNLSNSPGRVYAYNNLPSSFDPDAQAFITAAGITDTTQKNAINTLVVDLKGYGIWSKMKAIYPFVGGTASTHKWNLKDPRDLNAAFRLVFNGGWTHSATGAKPNGTNGWADTYKQLTISESINFSMGFYCRTNVGNSYGVAIGSRITGSEFFISGKWTDSTNRPFLNMGTSGFIYGTSNSLAGFYNGSRSATNLMKFYRNGSIINTSTFTETAKVNTSNFYIGAASDNNSPIALTYIPDELAFSYMSDSLTDTEAANLYTLVQNYQVALSRNV